MCCLDIRKFSLAHRVIDIWNSLDDNIIACDSINGLESIHFCMVEGSYKLLIKLPSLWTTEYWMQGRYWSNTKCLHVILSVAGFTSRDTYPYIGYSQ